MLKIWIYKHFKWWLYNVLWVVKHSETWEKFVLYTHLNSKKYWIRPIKMFEETINIDWKKIKRFKYIWDKKFDNI